jgi:HAD superfamily hydrolase (TIGR01509 family)
MTQAIILDLDGLIVDSEPIHQRSVNLLLQQFGIAYQFETEEYGKCFVGIPVIENVHYLKARFGLPGTPHEIVTAREALYESLIADPANLVMMPGVLDLLEAASVRRIPLGVASGSPRHQVETVLRGLGIIERFHTIVAGNEVPRTKPAPDVYLRAVAQLGVAPQNCIALEDSATGITAAKLAGMRAIAVPNRFTAHQDLSHADVCVTSLSEAFALLFE